jgi:predicted small metal-binding protein
MHQTVCITRSIRKLLAVYAHRCVLQVVSEHTVNVERDSVCMDEITLSVHPMEMNMKTMSCRQLGGACDKNFRANSFEEMAEISKQHGMDMFKKGDEAHLEAMNAMQQLMQNPIAMADWFGSKRREFEALPEN